MAHSNTVVSNRRLLIGGSDARIIMGSDEAALLRLWQEKRGEAEPVDLNQNLSLPIMIRAPEPPRNVRLVPFIPAEELACCRKSISLCLPRAYVPYVHTVHWA